MSSLLRSRVAPVLTRIVSTSRTASSGSDIIKSRELPEDKVTHTGQVNVLNNCAKFVIHNRNISETRMHSSRMRTARLPILPGGGGGGVTKSQVGGG